MGKLWVRLFRKLVQKRESQRAMDEKSIRIDSIHISRTYAGVLEGLPSTEESIEHAKHLARELWGDRPTVVIPPATTPLRQPRVNHREQSLPRERCPEWLILAWLEGPALKDGDGSQLIVIWFQDAPGFEVPGMLLHDLACDTWEKHAKDWWL